MSSAPASETGPDVSEQAFARDRRGVHLAGTLWWVPALAALGCAAAAVIILLPYDVDSDQPVLTLLALSAAAVVLHVISGVCLNAPSRAYPAWREQTQREFALQERGRQMVAAGKAHVQRERAARQARLGEGTR